MFTHPLHEKAKTLVLDYTRLECEILSLLQQIEQDRVFKALGYSSMFQYCVEGLGLSENQAFTFIGVSRKCTEVPALKVAIESGQINTSMARRILPVLEKSNSHEWIQKAAELPQKELEREVAKTNPDLMIREALRPVSETRTELRCGLSEAAEKAFSRARELLNQKSGKFCSLEEVIVAISEEYVERHDPVRKAERQEKRQFKTMSAKSSEHVARRSLMSIGSSARSKAIPAEIKHQVNRRDRGHCQYELPNGKACDSAFWSEIHHITPRSEGGADSPENLITLCAAHHDRAHDGERSAWKLRRRASLHETNIGLPNVKAMLAGGLLAAR